MKPADNYFKTETTTNSPPGPKIKVSSFGQKFLNSPFRVSRQTPISQLEDRHPENM